MSTTVDDLMRSMTEGATALQKAQQSVVDAVKKLGDHIAVCEAHVPNDNVVLPEFTGTTLSFVKADGTVVAGPVNLKGETGPENDITPELQQLSTNFDNQIYGLATRVATLEVATSPSGYSTAEGWTVAPVTVVTDPDSLPTSGAVVALVTEAE